jgi:hypothetical protein
MIVDIVIALFIFFVILPVLAYCVFVLMPTVLAAILFLACKPKVPKFDAKSWSPYWSDDPTKLGTPNPEKPWGHWRDKKLTPSQVGPLPAKRRCRSCGERLGGGVRPNWCWLCGRSLKSEEIVVEATVDAR